MKMKYITAVCAVSALVITLLPAEAGNITARMKRDCKSDYNRYCKTYKLGSESLRACMSRSIRKVSNKCVFALVDAGEMTQVQANGLKRKKKTAKR
jgi:hypothetical protein